MPGGRPTKYDPAFCDKVIEFGELGFSPAQMAARLGVTRQSLENWAEVHEEFLAALSYARTLCQAWWEDQAQMNLPNKEFNAQIWKKSVEARFREDYTETKNINATVTQESALDLLDGSDG